MRLRNIPRATEIVESHNFVIKNPKDHKSQWSKIFNNSNPIHIEIGMGKGQFIKKKAFENPEINYIGIERYSSVLLRALEKLDSNLTDAEATNHERRKMASDNNVDSKLTPQENLEFQMLKNLRFICMDAREIGEVFGNEEVSKIYLNFSDPWPKSRHAKRRLTSKEFLKRYEQVLKEDGKLELKTDNVDLFTFSLFQLEAVGWKLEASTKDLHQDKALNQDNIMTEYEEKFSSEGVKICKLICKVNEMNF